MIEISFDVSQLNLINKISKKKDINYTKGNTINFSCKIVCRQIPCTLHSVLNTNWFNDNNSASRLFDVAFMSYIFFSGNNCFHITCIILFCVVIYVYTHYIDMLHDEYITDFFSFGITVISFGMSAK